MSKKRQRKRRAPNLGFIAVWDDRWMDYPELWAADLWFKFLQLSPSYELARQIRADELLAGTPLPADMDKVLEVFDDLGDVQICSGEWAEQKQYRFMGHFGKRPSTAQLGVVRHDSPEQAPDIVEGFEEYLARQWIVEGKPSAVIAAIPLGMGKAEIIREIEAMLDGMMPDSHIVADGSPKYQVADKRNDLRSVGRYCKAMQIKLKRPALKNWQIGVMAKLSTAHSAYVKANPKRDPDDPIDRHSALKILTSRAFSRGHMIAENAARGIFPSYATCEHAMPLDWHVLHAQWRIRSKNIAAKWG